MPRNNFKKGNKIWDNPKVKEQYFKKGQKKHPNWYKKVIGRVPWNKGLKRSDETRMGRRIIQGNN